MLLSVFLGLFLADAVVSFVDDSLILGFGIHALTIIRGIVPSTPTMVIPNAVDVDYFRPSDQSIDRNAIVSTIDKGYGKPAKNR